MSEVRVGKKLQQMAGRLLRQICIVALLCGAPSVYAGVPARTIFQYKHTAWSVSDSAPPGIRALTQDQAGYLWVGSANGLYRFDGVTFESIAPSVADRGLSRVSALTTGSDGTVWVGYASGKIATYKSGTLQPDESTPKVDAYVMNLATTHDGAIWVQLGRPDNALLRRAEGRWQEIGTDWGLPRDWIIDTFVASDGALWVTTLQSVLVLHNGERRFMHVWSPSGHAAISEDPEKRIWLSDDTGSRIISGNDPSDTAKVFPTPRSARNFRARFDRDGNLWGVNDAGVFRVRSPASFRNHANGSAAINVEQFSKSDGLTSDNTVAILVDRENSVWIGTSLGLDRFRLANVVVEPALTKLPMWGFKLAASTDGSVYIGTANALYRAAPNGAPELFLETGDGVDTMCESPSGAIWVLLRHEVIRIREGGVARFKLPAGVAPLGAQGCVVDDGGVLWINGERSSGLHAFANEQWTHYPLVGSQWTKIIVADQNRRLIGLRKADELVELDQAARPREILLRHETDEITLVASDRRGLLVGGVFGLGRVDKGTLRIADSRRYPWLTDPSGIVETADGYTWLVTAEGIAGVATADLERAFRERDHLLRPTLLSFDDGLPNVSNRAGVRDAVQGGDGRIWFATIAGVVWVDPARLVRNQLAPLVAIRRVEAQGTTWRDPTRLALKPGTSSLSIDYAGLSLVIPERVRFRYRLEGVDEGWTEAGARRQANYSNLPPGDYRFFVEATNNDGLWSEKSAILEFSIPPTFIQSGWFKALCLLGFLVLAWGAYRVRMRQVTSRLQHGFAIRIAERERIARELHDTLLQGFQGLVLRLQSVANRAPAEGGMGTLINDALVRADAVLFESRARIHELRSEGGGQDLAQDLMRISAGGLDESAPSVRLTVEGASRALRPGVLEEARKIGEEAIRNAVRHARASNVDLSIEYGRRELRMAIRDDGIGIEERVLRTGTRNGHFGLVGMRERASRIAGSLVIRSRKGEGTEVVLAVPSHKAYADGAAIIWRVRSWLAGGDK